MESYYQRLELVLRSLAEIPEDQLQRVRELFHPLTLQKGEHFIRAGDIPHQLGFVVSGVMRFYYLSLDGNELTKSFCAENEFVAAYSALLLNAPARFSIEALENATLLIMRFEVFQALCEQHSCWQIVRQKLTEHLYIKKEQRESELLLDDAQTRYLNFRRAYPTLEERVKQYHIASYLGITPVSLSRIRTQLKKN